MKYKCKNCGWVGYQLVSDGSRDDESVCPKCGSNNINTIVEKLEDTNDYYSSIGDGMA